MESQTDMDKVVARIQKLLARARKGGHGISEEEADTAMRLAQEVIRGVRTRSRMRADGSRATSARGVGGMTMGELRDLVDALRERVAGLKEAASDCSRADDRFALSVRADEVDRCAAAIDAVLQREEGGQ